MIRELLTSLALFSCVSTYAPVTPWTTPLEFDIPKGSIVQLKAVSQCDDRFCLKYKAKAYEAWKQVLEEHGFQIYSETSALEETARKSLLDKATPIPHIEFYKCEYLIYMNKIGRDIYPESSNLYCTLNGIHRVRVKK